MPWVQHVLAHRKGLWTLETSKAILQAFSRIPGRTSEQSERLVWTRTRELHRCPAESGNWTLDPWELVKTRPSLPSKFPRRNQFIDTEGQVRNLRVAHKDTIAALLSVTWPPHICRSHTQCQEVGLETYYKLKCSWGPSVVTDVRTISSSCVTLTAILNIFTWFANEPKLVHLSACGAAFKGVWTSTELMQRWQIYAGRKADFYISIMCPAFEFNDSTEGWRAGSFSSNGCGLADGQNPASSTGLHQHLEQSARRQMSWQIYELAY